jgi:hypothetical protein
MLRDCRKLVDFLVNGVVTLKYKVNLEAVLNKINIHLINQHSLAAEKLG